MNLVITAAEGGVLIKNAALATVRAKWRIHPHPQAVRHIQVVHHTQAVTHHHTQVQAVTADQIKAGDYF
jgi:hypothetical protein